MATAADNNRECPPNSSSDRTGRRGHPHSITQPHIVRLPASTTSPPSKRLDHHAVFAALHHHLLLLLLLLSAFPPRAHAAHITGTFRPQHEFFKFIVKFGFQQTERHALRDSFGYVYGNITAADARLATPLMTLVVLDRDKFLAYYQNRTIYDKDAACRVMFGDINRFSYDVVCNPKATGDYLRRVPCPRGELCADEDAPSNVVAGNQFTYVISNLAEPRQVCFFVVGRSVCA